MATGPWPCMEGVRRIGREGQRYFTASAASAASVWSAHRGGDGRYRRPTDRPILGPADDPRVAPTAGHPLGMDAEEVGVVGQEETPLGGRRTRRSPRPSTRTSLTGRSTSRSEPRVLREDVSEWLTRKERTASTPPDSPLSVSVEAGKLDAIVYVLLHEATHVVDASLGFTPAMSARRPVSSGTSPPVVHRRRLERTHDPRSPIPRPAAGAGPVPRRAAETASHRPGRSVYTALRRTPFASLYGSGRLGTMPGRGSVGGSPCSTDANPPKAMGLHELNRDIRGAGRAVVSIV